MTALSDIERLVAIEEIKQLKARYFRLMDTKRWEEMYSLFAEDLRIEGMATAEFYGDAQSETGHEMAAGAKGFIDGLIGEGPELRTVHHGHMPEITITGPDTAHGIWAMYDYVEWPAEWTIARGLPDAQYGMMGYGHYDEDYRKVDGVWKIARIKLTRLRVDRLLHHSA